MKTKETTFTKTNQSKNLPPTIKSIVNALNKIKKKKKQGQERQKNNKKKSQTYVSTYQMIFKWFKNYKKNYPISYSNKKRIEKISEIIEILRKKFLNQISSLQHTLICHSIVREPSTKSFHHLVKIFLYQKKNFTKSKNNWNSMMSSI